MDNYFYVLLNLLETISVAEKHIIVTELEKYSIETENEFIELIELTKKEKLFIDNDTLRRAEAILKDCDDQFVHIINYNNQYYPNELKKIESAPLLLFMQGHKQALITKQIALVGRRNPSIRAQNVMIGMALECVKRGFGVVSGLAKGSDMYAHQATLDAKGITIGVLPIGLPHITPASNKILAENILKNSGALISIYPPDKKRPYNSDYTDRNRIITGLSSAVFVLEANEKGGSMNAYSWAKEQLKPTSCYFPYKKEDQVDGNIFMVKDGVLSITTKNDVEKFFSMA